MSKVGSIKIFKYKLKECEENKDVNRRSINGIVLKKDEWINFSERIEKLELFKNLIDCIEVDSLEEVIKIEEEKRRVIKEQQITKVEKPQIILEDTPLSNAIKKDIKEKIMETSVDKKRSKKAKTKIIEDNNIKVMYTSEIKTVDDYKKMTEYDLKDAIIRSNPKLYNIEDFKGRSKQDLLQTIFEIKGV